VASEEDGEDGEVGENTKEEISEGEGSKPLYSLGFGGRKALLSIPNGATARYLPKWVVALVLLGQKLPGLPLPNQAVQEAHTGNPPQSALLPIWEYGTTQHSPAPWHYQCACSFLGVLNIDPIQSLEMAGDA
jgi:hypothetical protein